MDNHRNIHIKTTFIYDLEKLRREYFEAWQRTVSKELFDPGDLRTIIENPDGTIRAYIYLEITGENPEIDSVRIKKIEEVEVIA